MARAVGVSRTLVSFAFRGAPGVSEETKQTILDAAKRLGYRPNAVAADLASKRASAVGLYLLDLRNEVYSDIFMGVRESLGQTANRLILSVSRTTSGIGDGSISSLIEARVGVIIAATLIDTDEQVRELAQSVALVNVARHVDGVDSVYSDDPAGARMATEHLLSLGHTRIVHVSGPRHTGHEGRWRAYEATMRDAGLTPRVVFADDFTQEAAEQSAATLLARPDRPSAIFAHNDQLALGIREAAYRRGLTVPGDLSLVGYDDSRIARIHGVDLTSVDLHALDLGRTAGAAALERLTNPGAPVVDQRSQPRLIVRKSTAPL